MDIGAATIAQLARRFQRSEPAVSQLASHYRIADVNLVRQLREQLETLRNLTPAP
jgi:hypothetical protein